MSINKSQVGFLKTIFPNTKVYLRQEPSRNSASVGMGKSDDKVIILKIHSPAANQPIWYYVQHERSGLTGWVAANKLFVLKEPNPETLAKLRDIEREKTINSATYTESLQSFNVSQSLLFGTQLIQKYFSYQ